MESNERRNGSRSVRHSGWQHGRRSILALLMIMMLMVALAGCGANGDSQGTSSEGQSAPDAAAENNDDIFKSSDAYSAYYIILDENAYEISNYYWQKDGYNEFIDDYTFDDDGNIV